MAANTAPGKHFRSAKESQLSSPILLSRSSFKVCHSVPYQLHCNRQDQKAKNTVDRAHGAWSQTFYEGSTETQKEKNRQAKGNDSTDHAEVREKVIGVGGQSHHHPD